MEREPLGTRLNREWGELWANPRKRLGWSSFFGWLALCGLDVVLFEADHVVVLTLLAMVLPTLLAWWKGWVKPTRPHDPWSIFVGIPLLALLALGLLLPLSIPAARWFVRLSSLILLGGVGIALVRDWPTARRRALVMVLLVVVLGIGTAVGINLMGLSPWGYIDKSGRFIIPPQFTNAGMFAEGLAQAQSGIRSGYIDKSGTFMIPARFDYVDRFSDGVAIVQGEVEGGGGERGRNQWLINASGLAITWPGQYQNVDNFSGGLAAVKKDGKWGYIEKTGKLVIPYQFDGAGIFVEGLAVVRQGDYDTGRRGVIDRKGTWVIPPQYSGAGRNFYNGLLVVRKEKQTGLLDRTGREVVPLGRYNDVSNYGRYNEGSNYLNSLVRVEDKNKRVGYVNREGKEVIPPQFEDGSMFSDGLAAVKKDGKWGYIEKTGKLVIPYQFQADSPTGMLFLHGLAVIRQGGTYGVINRAGAFVAPARYDEAEHAGEGMIRVQRDGQHGYLDGTGKEVIPCQFMRAWEFSEGLAPVQVRAGLWEMLAEIVVAAGQAVRDEIAMRLP